MIMCKIQLTRKMWRPTLMNLKKKLCIKKYYVNQQKFKTVRCTTVVIKSESVILQRIFIFSLKNLII